MDAGRTGVFLWRTRGHGKICKTVLLSVRPGCTDFSPGRKYAKKNSKNIPETPGAIVRGIDESLALCYRNAMEEIQDCTQKKYRAIYMVGGGIQSNLLCQMTANACKVPVITGPQEATVYGNLGMQLIAEQEVKDVKELRGLIRTSEDLKRYEPSDTEVWDEIYEIWKHTVKVREDNIL